MNIETLEREHGPEVVNHLSQALHMPGVSLEQMVHSYISLYESAAA